MKYKSHLLYIVVCISVAKIWADEEKIQPISNDRVPAQIHEDDIPHLSFEDDQSIHAHLESLFDDPALQRIVSIRSNQNASMTDIIDLIALSAGLDFVIDQDVAGTVGKISFEHGKTAGEILRILFTKNSPRLSLFKPSKGNIWRIATYDHAYSSLKSVYYQPLGRKTISLKYVRCDDSLKTKVEHMWQLIEKEQHHDHAYCKLDQESKKIFLQGSKKHIVKMEQFIKEIDCAVAQVRIDAIVAVVDRKYEHQFGFNWSGVYNRQSSVGKGFETIGVGIAPKNSPSGSADNFALNLFNKGAGALKVPLMFGGPDLSLQRLAIELHAAQAESKAKILLKPSVLTSHGETAEILIGSSVPIKTFVEDTTLGKVKNTQSYNYKDVGTILNVRPHVTADHTAVELDICVEDSVIGESTGDQAPTIKTIRTKNKVRLRSGQTTAIGGLMLNRDHSAKSGMPILSKLPLIGFLFRSAHKTQEDNQMVIFITPTIVA